MIVRVLITVAVLIAGYAAPGSAQCYFGYDAAAEMQCRKDQAEQALQKLEDATIDRRFYDSFPREPGDRDSRAFTNWSIQTVRRPGAAAA
jgi:hypothetical protein